ncbi:MAG TPA: Phenylacetic acid catabolic protein [Candidatus Binataceae bacterium]|nr:Phenylacetic acid catabolic protein [Candidatus Binataceae bacterium]
MSIQISLEGGLGNDLGIEKGKGYPVPSSRERNFLDYKFAGEAKHAYGLFQIAKDIGKDPHAFVAEFRRNPAKSRKLDAFKLDKFFKSHLGFETFCMLTETAGGIMSIAMMGSTYIPWAMWNARNYLDEGIDHPVISMHNVREAVARGEREECQALYDECYPYALDLFGSPNSENEKRYLDYGIKTMANTECRVIWMRVIKERTRVAGLKFPDDPYQGVRRRYDECREGFETNWGALSDATSTLVRKYAGAAASG